MRIRRFAAAVLASTLGAAALAVPSAQAAPQHRLGERSLAQVLTSDGNRFDRNARDYDIVTEAVLAVLAANPDSPVGVLADGSKRLTAFVPNDWSFRKLVAQLTGERYRSEKKVFDTLVSVAGVDTIEQVLLYHVVPGVRITSATARHADGAELTTAQGGTIKVDVIYPKTPLVQLRDQDPNATDPYLDPNALDINQGNRQIAHGIVFVLRPIDL